MSIRKRNKLVQGVGINDADYLTRIVEYPVDRPPVVRRCPYYVDWTSVLHRCYSNYKINIFPTYEDCEVIEEWKYFSNFRKWVDSQPNRDWQNCVLDKDLLLTGNKIYSPETCVYIPEKVNGFLISRTNDRGDYMLGVGVEKRNKTLTYRARCNNPINGKYECLGYFLTELEAHKAWQAKKHEHALRLAEEQQDPRVAKALRERYAPDKDWTNK